MRPPVSNRKPSRRSQRTQDSKLHDTQARRREVGLEVGTRPADGAPWAGSLAAAGVGLPGEEEGAWGRRVEARAAGVTTGCWARGEACIPGEGVRRRGDTARDGEAGEVAFARGTRRGHRQRRVLERIPPLGDRQRAAGSTHGPVALLLTGGGGGKDGERLILRPAGLGQRPEANKCDTRTGLSFVPAVCCLSSLWWLGRRCSQAPLPPPLHGVLSLLGALLPSAQVPPPVAAAAVGQSRAWLRRRNSSVAASTA